MTELRHYMLFVIGPVRMIRIQRIAFDPRQAMSVGRIDAHLRRRAGIGIGIHIERNAFGFARKLRVMPAVVLTDAMWFGRIASIQADGIDLTVYDRVFVGSDIRKSLVFIDG